MRQTSDSLTAPLPSTLGAFMRHFLKPFKGHATLFVCLALMAGFFGPFNALLMKYIINLLPQVQSEGNVSLLFWPAILVVVNFLIFDNVTWRSISYISYKVQATLKNQILGETIDQVLQRSHGFFQDNLSGRIANQITTLADNVENILHRLSLDFFRGICMLSVSFVMVYFVNVLFFYTLLVWFILFASVSLMMSKRLVVLADAHASRESTVSGQLVDCLSNNMTVRLFAKKDFELFRLDQFFSATKKAFQTKEAYGILLNCLQGFMIAVMMAFALYFLLHLYGKGLVSVGDFALIISLSMELGHMMWHTMERVDAFNEAVGKCKQSLGALFTTPPVYDEPSAKDLVVSKGEITFENVQFHYKGVTPLFKNKSVTLDAGQKVGLVGYSGGGKSTFVNLILRLYDVSQGHILIDSQDIKEVTQDSLRRAISIIPQDPSLFHRSLRDNIRYGVPDASDEDVKRAAQQAHAHDFISMVPQGYDALVGERGIKLSGGQRQRIAIARAILKNAPLLILDEATSQLDSLTENHIQESLKDLMRGKTSIVIAHRLSTLLHMDRLLVFDQGRIVEDGSHSALLKKGGLYKTLWEAQVGGFLPDHQGGEM